MDAFTINVLLAAAGVALIHTVAGPDHWLPFIMLARSRGWTLGRTLAITVACGIGHVGSSIVLGVLGLALGYEVARLAGVESIRGDLAAWALVLFGGAYALWGARRAARDRRGLELHDHDGHVHLHAHGAHRHGHRERVGGAGATFWSLFIIFVLGPCEPMIPLFMMPLSQGNWRLAYATAVVFSVVTVAAMVVLVALARAGIARLPIHGLERWSHALAGGVIAACGLGILVFGL